MDSNNMPLMGNLQPNEDVSMILECLKNIDKELTQLKLKRKIVWEHENIDTHTPDKQKKIELDIPVSNPDLKFTNSQSYQTENVCSTSPNIKKRSDPWQEKNETKRISNLNSNNLGNLSSSNLLVGQMTQVAESDESLKAHNNSQLSLEQTHMQLALNYILKSMKDEFTKNFKKNYSKHYTMRLLMKQIVNMRIKHIMIDNSIVLDTLMKIVGAYRAKFPPKTDLNLLKAVYETVISNSKYIQADSAEKFLHSNLNEILINKLCEIFGEVTDIYTGTKKTFDEIKKEINDGTSWINNDLITTTNGNKFKDNDTPMKSEKSVFTLENHDNILHNLLRKFIPYLRQIMNLDIMHESKVADIFFKANNFGFCEYRSLSNEIKQNIDDKTSDNKEIVPNKKEKCPCDTNEMDIITKKNNEQTATETKENNKTNIDDKKENKNVSVQKKENVTNKENSKEKESASRSKKNIMIKTENKEEKPASKTKEKDTTSTENKEQKKSASGTKEKDLTHKENKEGKESSSRPLKINIIKTKDKEENKTAIATKEEGIIKNNNKEENKSVSVPKENDIINKENKEGKESTSRPQEINKIKIKDKEENKTAIATKEGGIIKNKNKEENKNDSVSKEKDIINKYNKEEKKPVSATGDKESKLYCVKVIGRPTLPLKDKMQTFLNEFNPKFIKKLKKQPNFLFMGFTEIINFESILAKNGITIDESVIEIKTSGTAGNKQVEISANLNVNNTFTAECKNTNLTANDKVISSDVHNFQSNLDYKVTSPNIKTDSVITDTSSVKTKRDSKINFDNINVTKTSEDKIGLDYNNQIAFNDINNGSVENTDMKQGIVTTTLGSYLKMNTNLNNQKKEAEYIGTEGICKTLTDSNSAVPEAIKVLTVDEKQSNSELGCKSIYENLPDIKEKSHKNIENKITECIKQIIVKPEDSIKSTEINTGYTNVEEYTEEIIKKINQITQKFDEIEDIGETNDKDDDDSAEKTVEIDKNKQEIIMNDDNADNNSIEANNHELVKELTTQDNKEQIGSETIKLKISKDNQNLKEYTDSDEKDIQEEKKDVVDYLKNVKGVKTTWKRTSARLAKAIPRTITTRRTNQLSQNNE